MKTDTQNTLNIFWNYKVKLMRDSLGDQLKQLEYTTSTDRVIPSNHFIYARVDGRSFHSWTKIMGFKYPSNTLNLAMNTATLGVFEDLEADFGYVQSDEASFGWLPGKRTESQHLFGGKHYKLNSIIPSLFTYYFTGSLYTMSMGCYPVSFDCRLVDTDDAAVFQKLFYWRYLDAKRNGVNAFAQTIFSHKALQGKKLVDVQRMIADAGYTEEFNRVSPLITEGAFYVKGIRENVSRSDFVERFSDALPISSHNEHPASTASPE